MELPKLQNLQMGKEAIKISQKNFDYHTHITCAPDDGEQEGKLVIKGTAVTADIVNRNGFHFTAEVLKKAAKTLVGKPLLKDHTANIDNIIGKVTGARFDEESNSIQFKAEVMDEDVALKIRQGLIDSVSIGAFAKGREVFDEDGNFEFIDFSDVTFAELSLVAIPADQTADDIQVAMVKCFLTETSKPNKMDEENKNTNKEVLKALQSVTEQLTTLSTANKELSSKIDAQDAKIEKITQELESEEETPGAETETETETEEEVEEEVEDETQGEVADDEAPVEQSASRFKVEQGKSGMKNITVQSYEGLKNFGTQAKNLLEVQE